MRLIQISRPGTFDRREAELAQREGGSYETASELLARIKSDREGKITESKHKSGGD